MKSRVRLVFAILIPFWTYFIWATYFYVTHSRTNFAETICEGYGCLVIVTIGAHLIPLTVCVKMPDIKLLAMLPTHFIYILSLMAIAIFLIIDSWNNWWRLMPLVGLGGFLLVGFLISDDRHSIKWTTICWGLILQFVLGLLTLRWSTGRAIFNCLGDKVDSFLKNSLVGSAFTYGDSLVYQQSVFAFSSLTPIIFLGFFINILYYLGVMQNVILFLGKILEVCMSTSICESMNSAANIFVGMTEAQLLLRPYLPFMTDSEIYTIMTSGFSSVSGSVLASFIWLGANSGDLIVCCIMSAPAALCLSKLIQPEVEEYQVTAKNLKAINVHFESVIDAAMTGIQDGARMIIAIVSNVIAFIAFTTFVNAVLIFMGGLVGHPEWTLHTIIGNILRPLVYIMGVSWDECQVVGEVIGLKAMVSPFVALAHLRKTNISYRSRRIAVFAICGFATPGAIGTMISTMHNLVPTKKATVTRLVVKAWLTGTVVCFMTACIAATLME